MKSQQPTLGWSSAAGVVTSFEVNSEYDIIDVIRKRPELFLGSRTLTGLFHFMNGFSSACHSIGIELQTGDPPFHEFHQWIRKRLNGRQSAGWQETLLDATGNEGEAYERFLVEIDEFRSTQMTAKPKRFTLAKKSMRAKGKKKV